MVEKEEWIEEVEKFTDFKIPEEYQKIYTQQEMQSIGDLFSLMVTGELILNPDFQRSYIWNVSRASRFIESLLLELPVPPIFLAEQQDDKLVVIDGHQRLETIYRFLLPLADIEKSVRFSSIGVGDKKRNVITVTALTLQDLEVLSNINGKKLFDIETEKKKLLDYKISVVKVFKNTHPLIKYSLFNLKNA